MREPVEKYAEEGGSWTGAKGVATRTVPVSQCFCEEWSWRSSTVSDGVLLYRTWLFDGILLRRKVVTTSSQPSLELMARPIFIPINEKFVRHPTSQWEREVSFLPNGRSPLFLLIRFKSSSQNKRCQALGIDIRETELFGSCSVTCPFTKMTLNQVLMTRS